MWRKPEVEMTDYKLSVAVAYKLRDERVIFKPTKTNMRNTAPKQVS